MYKTCLMISSKQKLFIFYKVPFFLFSFLLSSEIGKFCNVNTDNEVFLLFLSFFFFFISIAIVLLRKEGRREEKKEKEVEE